MRETFYYIEVKRKTEKRWELHYAKVLSKINCVKLLKICRETTGYLPYEFRMVSVSTIIKEKILKY